MRVLALGGAGWMGLETAHFLVAFDEVSEVVIAGRDLETAERAAAELGDKASAVQIDVLDEERLASLASGADVVVNTAGPEWVAVLPALRAAIEAGVDYCDLCAYGPTTEEALSLDGAAKAAGVTAIVGIGIIGLTNLMLLHAAGRLDETEELRLCIFLKVPLWGSEPKTTLAEWREASRAGIGWQLIMKHAADRVRVYRDGAWLDVDPLEDGVRVTVPGARDVIAYPCALPEPITVPRTLKDVRSVSAVVSLFPPRLTQLWCELGRRISCGELDESTAAISFFEYQAAQPEASLALPAEYGASSVIWAEAVGAKHGKRQRYKCWANADWDTTAGPLAAAAMKILRGEIDARGVLAPESCLDPLPFFAEVAKLEGVELPGGQLLAESFEVLE